MNTTTYNTLANVFVLCVMVLLPIVPAYFLFKALPGSSAGIDGKLDGPGVFTLLKGMTVKLSGAFAGYFLVFAAVLGTHKTWMPPPVAEIYTVYGKIEPAEPGEVPKLEAGDFALDPEVAEVVKPSVDGTFRVTFATFVDDDGQPGFPKLVISNKDYIPVSFELDPHTDRQMKIDGRKMYLNPVKVTKVHPYVAQGPAPVPIPASQLSSYGGLNK